MELMPYEEYEITDFALENEFSQEISRDVTQREMEMSGLSGQARKNEIHPSLAQYQEYSKIIKGFLKKNGTIDQVKFALYVAVMYNSMSKDLASQFLAYILYVKGVFTRGMFASKKLTLKTEFPFYENIFEVRANEETKAEKMNFFSNQNDEDQEEYVEKTVEANAIEGFFGDEDIVIKGGAVRYPQKDQDDLANLIECFKKMKVIVTDAYGLFKTIINDVMNFNNGSFSKTFTGSDNSKIYPENPLDINTLQNYFFTQDEVSKLETVNKREEAQLNKKKKLEVKKKETERKRDEEDFLNDAKIQSSQRGDEIKRTGRTIVYDDNNDYEDKYLW